MDKPSEAPVAFQRAFAIRNKLAADDPNNALYADHLASSYVDIGDVKVANQNWDDATEAYKDANNILQKWCDKEPENSERMKRLNKVQQKLAAVSALRTKAENALQP